MNLADRVVDDLTTFLGGPGSVGGMAFAPASQHMVLVSYQRVPR